MKIRRCNFDTVLYKINEMKKILSTTQAPILLKITFLISCLAALLL